VSNNTLGNLICPGKEGDVVLLGFPHDEGVAINGGRPGAKSGPEKFRFWLNKYDTVENSRTESDISNLKIVDAGDISTDISLEEAHSELTSRTREILQSGSIFYELYLKPQYQPRQVDFLITTSVSSLHG